MPIDLLSEDALSKLAKQLELLEETLIYRFLDRAQFPYSPLLYEQQDPKVPSLLSMRLEAHEAMEQKFGRYLVAEEFPFVAVADGTATLEAAPLTTVQEHFARLQQGHTTIDLKAEGQVPSLPLPSKEIRKISQNVEILASYLDFLHKYCKAEDDLQYGSAIEHDIMALQAISRRVHTGAIFVAERKFLEQESTLRPLLQNWKKLDPSGGLSSSDPAVCSLQQQILDCIIRPEVEKRILQRVYDKALYIQSPQLLTSLDPNPSETGIRRSDTPSEPSEPGEPSEHTTHRTAVDPKEYSQHSELQRQYVEPRSIQSFYANCIIPLTKRGELAYLFRRITGDLHCQ